MELMSVLGALTGPPGEPEVPDARDPVTAAAFADLLAGLLPGGLVTPPAAAPAADEAATAVAAAAVGSSTGAVGADRSARAGGEVANRLAAAPPAGLTDAHSTFWGDLSPETDDPQPQSAPAAVAVASPGPATGTTPSWGELSPETEGPSPQGASAPAAPGDHPPVEMTSAAGPAPFWGGLSPETGDPQPQNAPAPVLAIETARPSLAGTPPSADAVVPAAVAEPPATAVAVAPNLSPTEGDGSGDDVEPDLEAAPPAAHLTGLARAEATVALASVAAPAAPAASTALERALAAQLVERVGTLRHREDGDYELSLRLEPADLGRVELRVRLEAGVVHVHVGAHSADTGDLLRRSLPELRAALLEAGLDAGRLDVGAHAGQPRSGREPGGDAPGWARTSGATPAPAARPATATTSVPTGARRGVDVLL